MSLKKPFEAAPFEKNPTIAIKGVVRLWDDPGNPSVNDPTPAKQGPQGTPLEINLASEYLRIDSVNYLFGKIAPPHLRENAAQCVV